MRRRCWRRGASLVEYAVALAVIVALGLALLTAFHGQLGSAMARAGLCVMDVGACSGAASDGDPDAARLSAALTPAEPSPPAGDARPPTVLALDAASAWTQRTVEGSIEAWGATVNASWDRVPVPLKLLFAPLAAPYVLLASEPGQEFLKGLVVTGLGGTVDGILRILADPKAALVGLGQLAVNLLTRPGETAGAIWQQASAWCTGNPARCAGAITFEVLTAILPSKAAKGGQVARLDDAGDAGRLAAGITHEDVARIRGLVTEADKGRGSPISIREATGLARTEKATGGRIVGNAARGDALLELGDGSRLPVEMKGPGFTMQKGGRLVQVSADGIADSAVKQIGKGRLDREVLSVDFTGASGDRAGAAARVQKAAEEAGRSDRLVVIDQTGPPRVGPPPPARPRRPLFQENPIIQQLAPQRVYSFPDAATARLATQQRLEALRARGLTDLEARLSTADLHLGPGGVVLSQHAEFQVHAVNKLTGEGEMLVRFNLGGSLEELKKGAFAEAPGYMDAYNPAAAATRHEPIVVATDSERVLRAIDASYTLPGGYADSGVCHQMAGRLGPIFGVEPKEVLRHVKGGRLSGLVWGSQGEGGLKGAIDRLRGRRGPPPDEPPLPWEQL
jgi:hypothetical protein